MIEIRLRAAGSNPSSRPWRWGISLVALALAVVAPVATSRAQDASPRAVSAKELDALRAMKLVTIDGGEAVSITSGAASITLKKDGTVVIRGTEIVIDNGRTPMRTSNVSTAPLAVPVSPALLNSRASEIF